MYNLPITRNSFEVELQLKWRFLLVFVLAGSFFSLGFTVKLEESGFRILETYLPAEQGNWVVHWLRRGADADHYLWFVNPTSEQEKKIAIGKLDEQKSHISADFVRPVGYISADEFMYTSVREINHSAIYSIKSFDMPSGKETVLFDNVLQNIKFYRGPIWLNDKKDVLMMASNTGEVVHFNLKKRTSFVLKKRFPADWPYDAISVSNKGKYFEAWVVYDLNGKVITTIRNQNKNVKDPQDIYGRFEFGPADKYVARSYTFDGSEEHALDPYTAPFDWSFGAQAIDIEKVTGELVRRIQAKPGSKKYVEIHHWKSPDILVLHDFGLRHHPDEKPDTMDGKATMRDYWEVKFTKLPTT
jgi:hypothetical protein